MSESNLKYHLISAAALFFAMNNTSVYAVESSTQNTAKEGNSGTVMKHGIEFSINELNPKETFDVRKVVSQDELEVIKKLDEEYFNKKYLNKEVIMVGPLNSIKKFSDDYRLTVDKFDSGMFSKDTSCYFSNNQKENLKTFLRLLTTLNYSYTLYPQNHSYVLIKGTLTSEHSMKNCRIIGLAETK